MVDGDATTRAQPLTIEIEPTADDGGEPEGGVLAGLLRQYQKAKEIPLPRAKGAAGKTPDLTPAQKRLGLTQLATVLDYAIGAALGPEAKMTADETALIIAPLEKMMADFPLLGIVLRYVGPISILVGIGLWVRRLADQRQAVAAQRAKQAAQAAQAAGGVNGGDQHWAIR